MPDPNVPTPHVQALEGKIAGTIPLPDDPLHARYIADNPLKDAKQFNVTRDTFGYTGTYKGERVSVVGTGMGHPSIGIYSHELIHSYGCRNLIHVGAVGALNERLEVYDMVFTMGACTTPNHMYLLNLPGDYSYIISYELLSKVVERAKAKGLAYRAGNVLGSDVLHGPVKSVTGDMTWDDTGVLAAEVEAAALYSNAAAAGVSALCTVTTPDSVVARRTTTAEEHQTAFTNMMGVALLLA